MRSMAKIQKDIDKLCREGTAAPDRETRLAWLLENAVAALRAKDPQSMGTCWLTGQTADVLERDDWDFKWRYNGS